MALLAAWCAMRFGELAELRRGDIDLRTNRVHIRREWCASTASLHPAAPSRMLACATSPSRRTWCHW